MSNNTNADFADFRTLFIVFFVLKTCSLIEWSWWYIFLPLIVAFILIIIKNVLILRSEKKIKKKYSQPKYESWLDKSPEEVGELMKKQKEIDND